MEDVSINIKNQNELLISGCLNFNNVTNLLNQAKNVLANLKLATINFSHLSQSNSAALIFMIDLLRYAKQTKKTIQFTHLSEQLLATAKISNLDPLLLCNQTTLNNS